MANLSDWFYLQLVVESELDTAFAAMEQADHDLAKDWGMACDDSSPTTRGGVINDWYATNPGGPSTLEIAISAGRGYDNYGRRVNTAASFTVDVTKTGVTAAGAAGIPGGAGSVATDPSIGFERWVSIFIVSDRLLGTPRIDGYGATIYYDRAESFHFHVTMGAEKAIGALVPGDKPAREAGELLLCDVRIKNLAGVISIVSYDQTRKEWWINATGTGAAAKTLVGGDLRDVFESILDYYSAHVSNGAGVADKHDSPYVNHTPAALWADGTGGAYGATTDVGAALEALVGDLADDATVAGSERIGADAVAGAGLGTTGGGAPPTATTLTQSTVAAQLEELLDALNSRIFRGGDDGIGGALIPAAAGTDLGDGTHQWDIYIAVLKACTEIECDLIPDSDGGQDLGTAAVAWGSVFALTLNSSTTEILLAKALVPTADQIKLGEKAFGGPPAPRRVDIDAYRITCGALPQMESPVGGNLAVLAVDLREAAGTTEWQYLRTLDELVLQRTAAAGSDYLFSGELKLPNGATVTHIDIGLYHIGNPESGYTVEVIQMVRSTGVSSVVGSGGGTPAVANPTFNGGAGTYEYIQTALGANSFDVDKIDIAYYLKVTTAPGTNGDKLHVINLQYTYKDVRID